MNGETFKYDISKEEKAKIHLKDNDTISIIITVKFYPLKINNLEVLDMLKEIVIARTS